MIKGIKIHKSINEINILNGIDISINEGEIVSVVGKSGAGKTTLLQILGTLEKPTNGKVLFNDKDVFQLNENELAAFRNKNIGFVFQSHHLLPEFTAIENVCIPAYIAKSTKKFANERAKYLIDLMGLSNRFNHKPSELSGGEQQRISVARALMNNPHVVLADEPTGNLDFKTSKEIFSYFLKLKKLKKTIIFATHNRELANRADYKLFISNGDIKRVNAR